MLGRVGRLEAAARREPGLELDRRAAARRQRPHRGDAAARDEDRAAEARLDRRDEQAQLGRAEAVEAAQAADGVLERVDPVAQAGRVLVAQRIRERGEAGAQARQRRRRIVELGGRERAGGERGAAPARSGPYGPGVPVTTTSSPRARR